MLFPILLSLSIFSWPVILMDKASASGAGDSRFESWADQVCSYQECSARRSSSIQTPSPAPSARTPVCRYGSHVRHMHRWGACSAPRRLAGILATAPAPQLASPGLSLSQSTGSPCLGVFGSVTQPPLPIFPMGRPWPPTGGAGPRSPGTVGSLAPGPGLRSGCNWRRPTCCLARASWHYFCCFSLCCSSVLLAVHERSSSALPSGKHAYLTGGLLA